MFHSLLNFFLPCILLAHLYFFNKFCLYSSNPHANIILNGHNNILNRTLSDSFNLPDKTKLRTSNNNKTLHKNKTDVKTVKTKIYNNKYSNDKNKINEVEIIEYDEPKKKETLEDLLEEYDEEMKEINQKNEKPFYKRALFLLDVFDNIFIDKLIDMNLKKKHSSLLDHIGFNSTYISSNNTLIGIPILVYLIRSFEFLNRYE
ncbi:Plasmodium exported protein (hyp6), unknown, putative [Plasmodium sp. DRC-Itaito]|nr:Plasmodium exported protein (hyp6), unknown, putative [Plasmodium sp. DRC-Itaito]